MSVEERRLILREKVEEGKRRIAERDLAADAKEAVDQAAGFVSKHPFALLAGALAVGLLLGGRGKKKAVAEAGRGRDKLRAHEQSYSSTKRSFTLASRLGKVKSVFDKAAQSRKTISAWECHDVRTGSQTAIVSRHGRQG